MSAPRPSLTLRIAAGSLVVSVIVLSLKALAAYWTGSVALYADALESVVNVVTAIAALIAVWFAAKPADAALPYGYGKAEYFSAVIIGVFIAMAAILILNEAYQAFVDPRNFVADGRGIAVSIGASVLNAGWALLLIRTGRRQKSPALAADGRHLMTDVISTVGVLIGVLLAVATGIHQLDAVLAALVAVAILWSGWEVLRQSVTGLMDVSLDARELAEIKEMISQSADGAIEAHDIRTRQSGRQVFIDFHLVVPGAMSVEQAHAICDRIEARLHEAIEDALITIHVEPEDKAKHTGIVVV